MKKLFMFIFIVSIDAAASQDRVEEITRDQYGHFNLPILANEISCEAKRDFILDQTLIIRSNPFVILVVDPEGSYEVFNSAKVSPDAECGGSVSVLDDKPMINLSCFHKLDPAGRRTEKHDVVIEFKNSGGSAVIQYSASTVTTTSHWKLLKCSAPIDAI